MGIPVKSRQKRVRRKGRAAVVPVRVCRIVQGLILRGKSCCKINIVHAIQFQIRQQIREIGVFMRAGNIGGHVGSIQGVFVWCDGEEKAGPAAFGIVLYGAEILRGRGTFELIDFEPTETKRRAPKKTRVRGAKRDGVPKERGVIPDDSDLFDLLRTRRTELAAAKRMPPYRIFSDSTLLEMAERKPMTRDELLEVSGVGEYKMKRYGQDFLDVIAEYIAESPDGEDLS